MRCSWIATLLVFGGAALSGCQNTAVSEVVAESAATAGFEAPLRLTADGKPIQVESPGYAAPGWADLTGDGQKELLVGQFFKGKIRVYTSLGDGTFKEGEWLMAEGEVAEVPGVW